VRLAAGPTSYIFARKEVPPYYAQKNDPPLIAGTHLLCLRMQGSAFLSSLIAGTHPVEAFVSLSVWSRTCTYILVDRSLCNDEPWACKECHMS
jgi:hypothetical protein